MSERPERERFAPLFLAFMLLFIFGNGLAAPQGLDPFYLKMFEDGEAAFAAGDHAKAVKDLEVAVFGLAADRARAAKACAYLALSHNALRNADRSRTYLRRAAGLIGKDDPRSLGLDPATAGAFEKLLDKLPVALLEGNADETPAPVWEKPVDAAAVAAAKPAIDPASVKALEGRLNKEPDNDVLRLDLASLYIGRRDHAKAVKLMRYLLKRDPEEIMATYHLSRALYFLKDPRKALEGFHKVIGPAWEERVPADAVLRSKIYIVLSLHALGQAESRDSYVSYLSRNVDPAELRRLLAEESLEKDWSLLRAEDL